ncbi:Rieske (2Fe-2S) protein [Acidocella aminolytica]|uniref:Rieske (2Fe-2S) n=1 Tax=Acidocella aminolytica 101 = DSM 11237 TaxID=1120923 RepID=A0A0D6PDF9_9PROT|nr:Rieske 2Fe-2S domain-containing protein [Acidocella aminolytica]GAN79233.1 rieske (2Fe-2S) [Acidocella aminolytica 101 = DSM 11237]GBQ33018.1 ferredoxin [Acidocella aminolytica 101 = DSM 11237]SHF51173.1 Ferredoxin subunit of nitrite reductase or a ring-hydroxylating dioxygenase [Acidocella aminolytica 101 = DSM 11237]
MGPRRIKLGVLADVPEGGAVGLAPSGNDDKVIALKRGDKLFLYKNDCPHNHRPLELKRHHFLSPGGAHITCFAHSAHFSPETGLCFAGPCAGQSLTAVPFSVIDGEIWAEI